MPDDTRLRTLRAELTALLNRHNATISASDNKAILTLWDESGEECDWSTITYGESETFPNDLHETLPEYTEPRAEAGQWVRYFHNLDGSSVWGQVNRVYSALDPEGSKTAGGASIFDHAQLRQEPYAYRLSLCDEDAARVSHPVVLAGSRIVDVAHYGPVDGPSEGGTDA